MIAAIVSKLELKEFIYIHLIESIDIVLLVKNMMCTVRRGFFEKLAGENEEIEESTTAN